MVVANAQCVEDNCTQCDCVPITNTLECPITICVNQVADCEEANCSDTYTSCVEIGSGQTANLCLRAFKFVPGPNCKLNLTSVTLSDNSYGVTSTINQPNKITEFEGMFTGQNEKMDFGYIQINCLGQESIIYLSGSLGTRHIFVKKY